MSSGIFSGPICCICWKALSTSNCVRDVLGNLWDCCPGDCAEKAGIELGPVNFYVYNQLELEDIAYQKRDQEMLKNYIAQVNLESSFDSVGLFQQRPSEW